MNPSTHPAPSPLLAKKTPSSPPLDVTKERLFRELGYAAPHEPLEEALREAGLSRPDKGRIALAKRERVREILEERFVRVCARGDCQREAVELEGVLPAATSAQCDLCGGSPVERLAERVARRCLEQGVHRVCVVGGSPIYRARLNELLGKQLTLRLVDGKANRDLTQAEADLAWADRLLISGPSMLSHKVSQLYRPMPGKTVLVKRRGLRHMLEALQGP
ncbi:MAG: hypothetical protein HQL51_00235 [Magnetococcales bacterium]|nr:hypothetical protein [Magnetococcales bacterium]